MNVVPPAALWYPWIAAAGRARRGGPRGWSMAGRATGRRIGALLLLGLLLGGCATTHRNTTSQLPTEAVPPTEGVLGARDLVAIRVLDEPDLSGEYRVEADGTIDFPLLGPVAVRGMTPPAAAAAIATRLEDGYLRTAVVTMLVREYNSRQIVVIGQVRKPGPLPYDDGMTLVEAIARAGGLTDQHAANRTTLTRQTADGPVVVTVPFGDVSAGRADDVELRPGDVIFVPESPI